MNDVIIAGIFSVIGAFIGAHFSALTNKSNNAFSAVIDINKEYFKKRIDVLEYISGALWSLTRMKVDGPLCFPTLYEDYNKTDEFLREYTEYVEKKYLFLTDDIYNSIIKVNEVMLSNLREASKTASPLETLKIIGNRDRDKIEKCATNLRQIIVKDVNKMFDINTYDYTITSLK